MVQTLNQGGPRAAWQRLTPLAGQTISGTPCLAGHTSSRPAPFPGLREDSRVSSGGLGQADSVQLSLPSSDLHRAESPKVSTAWVQRVAFGAVTALMLAGPAAAAVQSGLIATSGVAAARPAEALQLTQRLAKVDPALLKLLTHDGVSFGVVRPGISFVQTGVIPTRSLQSYQAELPQMQAQARSVQQAVASFDRGISTLQKQRAAATESQQISSLDQRLGELQRQRYQAILDIPGPAVPYRIPSLAGLLRDKDGLHKLVAQQAMPKGTNIMAQLVGATRPEHIREYTALVEAINGARLQEARVESLARATPSQREQWQKDPGQIPLDIKGFSLLVPDLAYVPDGQGGVVRTSLQDASVVSAWSDVQGKTLSTSTINGQYFPQSRRILVQSHKVALNPQHRQHAHTPVHELGHAVEDAVQRHDPQFYGRWSARLQAAFSRAQSQGTITDYAASNPAEYIAEGVGHYYEDAALLKSKDPQLFALTQQLLERAAQIGAALPVANTEG